MSDKYYLGRDHRVDKLPIVHHILTSTVRPIAVHKPYYVTKRWAFCRFAEELSFLLFNCIRSCNIADVWDLSKIREAMEFGLIYVYAPCAGGYMAIPVKPHSQLTQLFTFHTGMWMLFINVLPQQVEAFANLFLFVQ